MDEKILWRIEELSDRMANSDLATSLQLLKLYSGENIEIILNRRYHLCDRITKALELSNITYSFLNDRGYKRDHIIDDGLDFGEQVNFQDLYILASFLKHFGVLFVSYTEGSDNTTIIAPFKVPRAYDNSVAIDINAFLKIPFYSDIETVVKTYFAHNEEDEDYDSLGAEAYGYQSWDEMSYYEVFEGDVDALEHYNQ